MQPMYINGEFTRGEATGAIEVANPATEEVMTSVPRGTERDIGAAVAAAKDAISGWRVRSPNIAPRCCTKWHTRCVSTKST